MVARPWTGVITESGSSARTRSMRTPGACESGSGRSSCVRHRTTVHSRNNPCPQGFSVTTVLKLVVQTGEGLPFVVETAGVEGRSFMSRACAAGAVVLMLNACGSAPGSPTPTPGGGLTPRGATAEWPVAAPQTAGFDAARLADLAGRIRGRAYGTITSLLIVRDGQLVV